MKAIQLLYARNIISKHKGTLQQDLLFFMRVKNLAYDKKVEIHWTGEDGWWHKQEAQYHSTTGQDSELWYVHLKFYLSDDHSLPGDIEFALRYRVLNKEYWDNNSQKNYILNADSGVQMARDISLVNIDFNPKLRQGQQFYPITVAVRNSLNPKQVNIHWSTDGWKTVQVTPCFFKRKHWNKISGSNARNPNKYDTVIWISQLQIDDAYKLEYAIACQTDSQTIWDNNFGRNYRARHQRLKVLILNLHCYQEENQQAKFRQIAKTINELDIDLVCFQEVPEHWNNGQGDWNSNAARIISEQLKGHYHLHTAWSHLGFDHYREGVAILSKHKFVIKDSGYVSASENPYDIHARKVVMAQVWVPYIGLINVFSAHLSWWSGGFAEQFERLRQWANHKHSHQVNATLLCGDFNIKAGSQGYGLVLNTREYEDQFLKATSRNIFDKIFHHHSDRWAQYLVNDGRIDYIFMKKGSNLRVTSARPIFTEQEYGRVSDHYGYYMEFEPR